MTHSPDMITAELTDTMVLPPLPEKGTPTTLLTLQDCVIFASRMFDSNEAEDRLNILLGMAETSSGLVVETIYGITVPLGELAESLAPTTRQHAALVYCIDGWGYPRALAERLTVEQILALSAVRPPSDFPDRVGTTSVVALHRDGRFMCLHKHRDEDRVFLSEDTTGQQVDALRYLIGL